MFDVRFSMLVSPKSNTENQTPKIQNNEKDIENSEHRTTKIEHRKK
jgi:hypothetical protein